MAGYQIGSVSLSKSIVSTGENLIISVAVIDWDFMKRNFTWASAKSRFSKWGDLIG